MEEKGVLSRRLERLYMDYIEIEKILKRLRDIKRQCSYRSLVSRPKATRTVRMAVEADVRRDEEFGKMTKGCMKFDVGDEFWTEVSQRFGMPRNECFNRWINNVEQLGRKPLRGEVAEAKRMREGGADWIEMSRGMGCTPFRLFCEYVRSNTVSVPKMWGDDEDKLLEQGVEKYGLSRWRYVSRMVGTRTGKECAMRFYFLNKNVRKGKWTQDEKDRLMEGVEAHGEGDWRSVSTHVKTRNPIQCRSKYISETKPRDK